VTRAPVGRVLAVLAAVLFVSGTGARSDAGEAQIDAAGAAPPAFSVRPRLDHLSFYPCADCHEFMDTNDSVRELEVAEGHPAVLQHGGGAMWCLSCHQGPNYDSVQNLMGQPIDFDEGYRVCSGCHGVRFREWTHGGHGKRVANWQGERVLFSCVECHNPHAPAIAPRTPQPPPPVRAGLERVNGSKHEPAGVRPWLREGAGSE